MLDSFPYLYIAVYIIAFSIAIAFIAGAFIVFQIAWDRFWTVSFPILVEVYWRWRYPEDFTQQDN